MHQVASAYAAQFGVAPILRVRSIVAGFEGNGAYASWTAANDADYQQDLAFLPDVVVIAIGENLGTYDETVFREKFLSYCQGFANLSPKPTILIRAPFWNNSTIAGIEQSVADEAHARTTLATILAKCRRNPDDEVFNNMRDFILPGEAGLRMAWYPEECKSRSPFPYYQETMTGFEYVVAAGLAQRGEFAAAEQVVRDIRDRYDGEKRNPFDETECGHHYVRAMAAWSVLKAFETFKEGRSPLKR